MFEISHNKDPITGGTRKFRYMLVLCRTYECWVDKGDETTKAILLGCHDKRHARKIGHGVNSVARSTTILRYRLKGADRISGVCNHLQ
jgi:hypothetical protein